MSSVWNLEKFKRCNVVWYFFRRQGSKFPWKLSTWCPRASYLPPSLHGCCCSSWTVSVCSSRRSVYGSRAQGKCKFCTCDIQISGGLFFLVTMAVLSRKKKLCLKQELSIPAGFAHVMENQESHMELKQFILIFGPWKSWKINVLCGRLVTSDDKQGHCKIKSSN